MSDNRQPNQAELGRAPSRDGTRPLRLRGDYLVAIAVFLFAAVVFYLTTTFDEVPSAMAQGVPPTQFPRLLLGLICVLAAIMVFQAHGRTPKKRKPVPGMVYASAALLIAFVAAVTWLGVIIAMVLFCVALPLLWGERRIWVVLIYAVVFPIFVYALFSGVMEVRFPLGPLESLLR